MGPLLALDVDGVLNSEVFIRAHCLVHGKDSWNRKYGETLDPAAVRRLNAVTDQTGAKIVVSSTWRIGRSVEELRTLLNGQGITGEIIGKTPRLWRTPEGKEQVRGDEIALFIKELPEPPSGVAIVDDDSDMAHMTPWWVGTSWITGLQDIHRDRLICMLERPFVMSTP